MKDLVNDGFAKVVKPYIDSENKKDRELIAPVEVSPAESAHSIGDQIIYNGILYDVTAQIAVDDPLATSGVGANISAADNIEAQIKATKSQIQTAAAEAAAQNKNTQEMIAPVEEDETDASRAYAIGDQLILDGVLYNVIDAIAQHGIITSEGAGANIEEADDVTTQLTSLNQTLTNQVKDMNNVLGSKNLLPISLSYLKSINTDGTWNGNAYTVDSVTYTVNTDSQGNITDITTSGTASSNSALNIYGTSTSYGENNFSGMILNGCPSGGGTASTDYRIVAFVGNSQDGTGHNTINDIGDGVTLTNASYLRIYLRIPNGYSSSLVFKPMIRLASIEDDTYAPYAKTNQQLTQDTTALLDNLEVNGAVNILPNEATPQVIDGVTFTVNDDGTFVASGTHTQSTAQSFTIYSKGASNLKVGKTYRLSNGLAASLINCNLVLQLFNSSDTKLLEVNCPFGVVDFTVPSGTVKMSAVLWFKSTAFGTSTFYPMITVASYNGDYVPYAKSNKELTDESELITLPATKNDSIVGSFVIKVRKQHNAVYVTGYLNTTVAANKNDLLFTISDLNFFDANDHFYILMMSSDGDTSFAEIYSNGEVKVGKNTGMPIGYYMVDSVLLMK